MSCLLRDCMYCKCYMGLGVPYKFVDSKTAYRVDCYLVLPSETGILCIKVSDYPMPPSRWIWYILIWCARGYSASKLPHVEAVQSSTKFETQNLQKRFMLPCYTQGFYALCSLDNLINQELMCWQNCRDTWILADLTSLTILLLVQAILISFR